MTFRYHSISFTLSLLLIVLLSGCSSTNNSTETLQPADLLPASGEITGWEKGNGPGDYEEADDEDSLRDIINGGAEIYILHGFQEGVHQNYYGFINSVQVTLQLIIYDQGSSSGAAALFDEEQVVPSNIEPWNLGDEAYVDETTGLFQTVVYVRTGRFFIKVIINREEDPEQALITAQLFATAVVEEIEG